MRIIIETDSNTQPGIQLESQVTGNVTSLQPAAVSGKAINAGAPQVEGSLQPGARKETDNAAPQDMNTPVATGDTSSAGAAPAGTGG